MKITRRIIYIGSIILAAMIIITLTGCSGDQGKMPITADSKEALNLFIEGRDLSERLRLNESRIKLDKATELDPGLALAYVYKSMSPQTPKDFLENMDKAVSLMDNITEGERLVILGLEALSHAKPLESREYYKRLVELYPRDERAHFFLASNYFNQQDYAQVVEETKIINDINPNFSPSYNLAGYAYRYLEDYKNAEESFKKYIKLVPNDPNPYDSYADLLMKMGKYGESIESYYKALQIDETFAASHIGIASNLNYLNKHKDARDQLHELYDLAINDGQRRDALLAIAISYMDEGFPEKAIETIDERYAFAEKNNDYAAMANDLSQKGYIYIEMGKYKKAQEEFDSSLQITQNSNLSEELKENAKRISYYANTRAALVKTDLEAARTNLIEFRRQVEEINNPTQIRLAHQLAGMIALEEDNYDMAIAEFRQTSQQDPMNLYFMARAYLENNDPAKAKEWLQKTVEFNSVSSMNYAFVRQKAITLLAELEKKS
ncbi:MAG: tetratricopeptide repeat protein [Candidatus Zixiibacteriota bacterium]